MTRTVSPAFVARFATALVAAAIAFAPMGGAAQDDLPLPPVLPPLDLEAIYNPPAPAKDGKTPEPAKGETPAAEATDNAPLNGKPTRIDIVTPHLNSTQKIEPLSIDPKDVPNYRQHMRDILIHLAQWSKPRNPNFSIIVADGFPLFARSKREVALDDIHDPEGVLVQQNGPAGTFDHEYLSTIDGVLIEGLFCGTPNVNSPFVELMTGEGKLLLTSDHCKDTAARDHALQAGKKAGYIPHADTDLTDRYRTIPTTRPVTETPDNIFSIREAHNMLINTDPAKYPSKEDWITALGNSSHDVLVIDAFYDNRTPVDPKDVEALKFKRFGSRRLVFARLNAAVASDRRYYWRDGWTTGSPAWLAHGIEERPGEYYTSYWDPAWKEIMGRTFAGIMDLGFDGVIIDGLDTFDYWERRTPLE